MVTLSVTTAFHKMLEISQNVAQRLLQKKSKYAFYNKSCPNVSQKKEFFFSFVSFFVWYDAMKKYVIWTTKIRFLNISVQFCIVTGVAK